ncbi:MAG: CoA transferase [Kordiimonadales bacterium]|nr:MAG: CoA transferase [Kordiimonadales bacterium]
MAGPLKGIRVLDLSRILAGPWSTQCLADMGADVIKIERPKGGDDTRTWGPPFFDKGAEPISAYFLSANRGKRSVAIDMATGEGQKLICDLAKHCDILVENFKVGGLKKYGLDYASMKVANPGLIYCSITGFGQDGPYKDRPGYDALIQAMGGMMKITGAPESGPQRAGVAITDLFTGLYSAIGILGALHHREKTGEGQHIDMSLLDTQVAALANQSLSYLVSGKQPARLGTAHPSIVPYQAFETSDGDMVLAVGNDSQFRSFCDASGLAYLVEDDRYKTNPARVENRDTLIPVLTARIAQSTTDEWTEMMAKASVPGGPINDMKRVFADPQVKARGLALELPGSEGELVPGVANPIRYSKTVIEYKNAPPHLGADTEQVLAEILGLSGADIEYLKKADALG